MPGWRRGRGGRNRPPRAYYPKMSCPRCGSTDRVEIGAGRYRCTTEIGRHSVHELIPHPSAPRGSNDVMPIWRDVVELCNTEYKDEPTEAEAKRKQELQQQRELHAKHVSELASLPQALARRLSEAGTQAQRGAVVGYRERRSSRGMNGVSYVKGRPYFYVEYGVGDVWPLNEVYVLYPDGAVGKAAHGTRITAVRPYNHLRPGGRDQVFAVTSERLSGRDFAGEVSAQGGDALVISYIDRLRSMMATGKGALVTTSTPRTSRHD